MNNGERVMLDGFRPYHFQPLCRQAGEESVQWYAEQTVALPTVCGRHRQQQCSSAEMASC